MKFFLLHSDVAKSVGCLSSAFLNWDSQQGRDYSNTRMQQNKISTRPILFLYYEESLNLNSKLLRFHCVRPNIYPNNFTRFSPKLLNLWQYFTLKYFVVNNWWKCRGVTIQKSTLKRFGSHWKCVHPTWIFARKNAGDLLSLRNWPKKALPSL